MELHSPPLNNAALGKLSGVHESFISRYLNGKSEPTPERVAQLCSAISAEPAIRAQLLVAYLRDVAVPALSLAGLDSRDVCIECPAHVSALDEPTWFSAAPLGLQVKLELIGRAAAQNPKVQALLDAMVDLVGTAWRREA